MPALADQVQVEVAERGRITVRVVVRRAVHLDPVVEHLAGEHRLEDTGVVHPLHRVPFAVGEHRHLARTPA